MRYRQPFSLQPAKRVPRPESTDDAIARKLYEICVARGYVDSRDWVDAAAQLRTEKELAHGPSRS